MLSGSGNDEDGMDHNMNCDVLRPMSASRIISHHFHDHFGEFFHSLPFRVREIVSFCLSTRFLFRNPFFKTAQYVHHVLHKSQWRKKSKLQRAFPSSRTALRTPPLGATSEEGADSPGAFCLSKSMDPLTSDQGRIKLRRKCHS